MITADQVRAYRDNGFIVVPRLFGDDVVQRMRAAVARIVEEARGKTAHDARYDLDPAHRPDNPKVRRIKQPHQADPIFDEVMRDPKLIGILDQLLPNGVRMRTSKLNMKEAGGGAPVEWHQDWAFYPHTNDDVLAVGVMLDDVAMENGPLLVIPGSHTGPTYSHHDPAGYFCGAIDPEASGIDFNSAVPCLGPAGSVSIHHARLLHGSAENQSTQSRRLLLYEFTAGDAWPLLGISNLADFDAQLLSGRPNIEPRIVPAPVRMPLPPAPYQGSIYENQTTLKNRFFGRQKAAV